ncbi:UNVERIFIED_CONTAM: hypothetical protein PYX00_010925 [Menopon gallinae]|uniref:Uncharacterized protein n=1 Tax=Menopon gallinae TaxID=328185 RepID=A0AAW2H6X1_9NEOP
MSNLIIDKNTNDSKDSNGVIKLKVNKENSNTIKTLTPEEISGYILKYIKEKTEELFKTKISKAVITVPAYFNESARMATKNAAHLAGLEVMRLINEPTAAALAYGLDDGISGSYLIYDLGGGTFDVSILQLQNGVFRVIATKGDLSLGGDDFDYLIALELINIIKDKYNVSIKKAEINKSDISALMLQAKSIKEKLSNSNRTTTSVLFRDKEYKITFEQKALHDANLSENNLNGIILVGGSTRLNVIKQLIKKTFNLDAYCTLNPDEVVAIGAGYQAANLNGDIKKSLLLDITPLSLGIETYGGIVEKIVFRNTPIPVSKTQNFTTFKDNQTSLILHILQGERELVKDNQSLAKFTLKGIPPMPAGVPRIEVNFTIDTDGLLKVTAKEKISNICNTIEIKPTFGLDVNHVKEMILDSIKNAESDIEKRSLEISKTNALHLMNVTKHAIKEDKDLLSSKEMEDITNVLNLLQKAVEKNNSKEIKDLTIKLNLTTEDFANKRISKAIKSSLEGEDINNVKF